MKLTTVIMAGFLPFAVVYAITHYFHQPKTWMYILDYPSKRSLHAQPIPRNGGLAILGGILIGVLVNSLGWQNFSNSTVIVLGIGLLSLTAVSVLDDCRGIAAR